MTPHRPTGRCTGPIATTSGTSFDLVEPGTVDEMLNELKNDRTAIFWG